MVIPHGNLLFARKPHRPGHLEKVLLGNAILFRRAYGDISLTPFDNKYARTE